tara:strand:- start:914 stop:1480 length:567 start_codon:yes stop_codon:yes gene_type:complete
MKGGDDATKARLISEELAFLYYIAIACNTELTFLETTKELVDKILVAHEHWKKTGNEAGDLEWWINHYKTGYAAIEDLQGEIEGYLSTHTTTDLILLSGEMNLTSGNESNILEGGKGKAAKYMSVVMARRSPGIRTINDFTKWVGETKKRVGEEARKKAQDEKAAQDDRLAVAQGGDTGLMFARAMGR